MLLVDTPDIFFAVAEAVGAEVGREGRDEEAERAEAPREEESTSTIMPSPSVSTPPSAPSAEHEHTHRKQNIFMHTRNQHTL